MKNLLLRSTSGLAYVFLLLGTLFWLKEAFALVCLIFALIGLYEFQRFSSSSRPVNITLIIAFFVFSLFHFVFSGVIAAKWGVLSLFGVLIIYSAELFKKNNGKLVFLTTNITGLIYILAPMILLNYLNIKSENYYSELVLVTFILVWVNDTFAYLSGLTFGKHKLFERITPKKTWEGFIGGILASLIAGYVLKEFVKIDSVLLWEFFVLIIAVSAVFGDFTESWFKRTAGVKDSGNIMPGHGGILDRIDSLLFVIPVVFIYFELTK